MEIIYNNLEDITTIIAGYLGESSLVSVSLACKPFNQKFKFVTKNFAKICAKDGNLNLLIWAYNGAITTCRKDKNCKCYTTACGNAAYNGNLQIVEWFDNISTLNHIPIVYSAIFKGNLNILEYFYEKEYKFHESDAVVAAQHGHLHILKWLKDKNILDIIDNSATFNGHLHILQWLQSENISINIESCSEFAAQRGHVHILKWLKLQGQLNNQILFENAVVGYQPKIVEYLVDNGFIPNNKNLNFIIEHGRIEILKYFINLGYILSEESFKIATMNGEIEILKLLFEQYSPFVIPNIIEFVVNKGQFETFKYLINRRITFDAQRILKLSLNKLVIIKIMIISNMEIYGKTMKDPNIKIMEGLQKIVGWIKSNNIT